MEQNNSLIDKEEEGKLNGIKVIADQMARNYFGYDENSELINSKISKDDYYKLMLDKNKNNETEGQKMINDSKINDDNLKIVNQIQDINSNINTNMNTKENQNTLINTNINTGTNVNTNPNNNINNDNENNSNREIKKNQSSFIEESINDDKNDLDKESSREIDISIEKVSTKLMGDFFEDSLDNINTLNIVYNKTKKTSLGKRTIYERSVFDIKKRENKLNKKRKEKINKTMKEVKPFPGIDPYSEELVEKSYIPIQNRAATIHSLKLFNYIMNQEQKKIKEENDLNEIKKYKNRNKKFDQKNWNKFIKRQKKWNKNVQYKIKAAILMRDIEENEYYFKPKINERSKSMIKGLEEESKNYIDEVYCRLYNDFEEHKERQKFRNQQSLPSFKPKIIKSSSQKIIEFNPRNAIRSGTNPMLYLKNKNKVKQSYIMNKSMENKAQEYFIDSCTNFQKRLYNKDSNKYNKYLKYINKSQQTNQQSKNNFSNINCSNVSSGLINSKYIILDNKYINKKEKP